MVGKYMSANICVICMYSTASTKSACNPDCIGSGEGFVMYLQRVHCECLMYLLRNICCVYISNVLSDDTLRNYVMVDEYTSAKVCSRIFQMNIGNNTRSS